MADATPEESNKKCAWKNDVFRRYDIQEVINESALDGMFQHVAEIPKDRSQPKNKRIYIGPGRDGSSDDKISVGLKFEPLNTKVTSTKVWKDEGYRNDFLIRQADGAACRRRRRGYDRCRILAWKGPNKLLS